ncbi:MAG: methyltransferase domain-containing protein [Ferruginibacter sp.]
MDNTKSEKCCVVNCNLPLGQTYWNSQYDAQQTGWDLGEVSPPLKSYINQLTDKQIRILIPGCGNSYEASYLLQQGFTNITVIDIAPTLVNKLKEKFHSNKNIKIILGDFFEHKGSYDLIFEQTFFCALDPALRPQYVSKMKELLVAGGKLVGLLFDREFDKQGPPFGGCKCQYEALFKDSFKLDIFEPCYNSFVKRQATELFIKLVKQN